MRGWEMQLIYLTSASTYSGKQLSKVQVHINNFNEEKISFIIS